MVFGSRLHEKRFHEWADVDLAVWEWSPEQTFRAIGAMVDLDCTFEINLVDVNACSLSLLALMEQEGKDLY